MQAASHRYSRDDAAIFMTCEKQIKGREGSTLTIDVPFLDKTATHAKLQRKHSIRIERGIKSNRVPKTTA